MERWERGRRSDAEQRGTGSGDLRGQTSEQEEKINKHELGISTKGGVGII